ncbi:tetratricopeptide repeat (TPR)-like superfamily protein [Artemisia annua]|uniref:Tetratricopeptide repeat (TPR)-like superfamily protein n=1 Tax=Artemisia annua TaxID=35608 RepID=A0A2U1KPP5_ARTAN|nr:tetratricopeptide repeat (TPR)-like superfamily protein [Artemisia annua]
MAMLASPPSNSYGCIEKKHWWLTNKKIVDKYVKDARALVSSQEQNDIASALNLLDAALNLSPKYEQAIELKARSLLYLRRYKQVADMLQDYIPSLRMDESSTSSSSSSVSSDGNSQPLSRERVKLLSSGGSSPDNEPSFKCFSVSDLKKKVMAGLSRNCDKEGQWRKKASAALQQMVHDHQEPSKLEPTIEDNKKSAPVYQGVFCRDIAVVGSLLSQAGFNRPIPVKYEALSC